MTTWKKSIAALCAMQFLAMVGVSEFLPFLPVYVQELGVKDSRDAAAVSGLLFGVGFLAAAVMAPFWGHVGDRWGRRRMAIRAMLGSAFALFLMGFARHVTDLALLRVLQGALGGFVSSTTALAVTFTPEDRVGAALGYLQASLTAGIIAGPLLGGALLDLWGFRWLVTLSAALMAMGALVVLLLVPADKPATGRPRGSIAENVRFVFASPTLRTAAAVQGCLQVALMAVQPVLALFVHSLAPEVTARGSLTGLVFGITAFATLGGAAFLGRRSDAWGPVRVLQVCLLGAALLYLPQAFVGGVAALILLRGLLGIFIGGVQPTVNSVIVRAVPPDRRGGVLGITFAASLLGNALGPVLGGAAAHALGLRAPFLLSAVLMFAAWAASRRISSNGRTALISPAVMTGGAA